LLTQKRLSWRNGARNRTGKVNYQLKPFREDEFPREELGRVILKRGSARRFERGEAISFRQFSTLLYHSMQGIPAVF
jgi:hypothetical protein